MKMFHVLITYLFLTLSLSLVHGSVTIMSGESISVYMSHSVTLYCLIEPFNYDKCHRWYKQSPDGSVQMIAEGSYLYETETEPKVGDLVKPENLNDFLHEFSSPCQKDFSQELPVTSPEEQEMTTWIDDITKTQQLTSTKSLSIANSSMLTSSAKVPDHEELSTHASTLADLKNKYYPARHDSFYLLTIAKLAEEDEGKYFCQYYCEECDSRKTELIFTAPAELDSLVLKAEPEVDFVEIGEVVKLTCEVKSRPQAILKWILVLNGRNVPHVESTKPLRVVFNPQTNLFTVTSVFHFVGGNIHRNPMIIYCEVLSPVHKEDILDHSMDDLLEEEQFIEDHKHKRRKRGTSDEHDHSPRSNKSIDYDNDTILELEEFLDNVHYEFESHVHRTHISRNAPPIDFRYLTTKVYKRKIFRLPTAAFDKRWRTALIAISSTILILPVIVGFIQIILRKTESINPTSSGKGIQDYYKIVNTKRNFQNAENSSKDVEEEA